MGYTQVYGVEDKTWKLSRCNKNENNMNIYISDRYIWMDSSPV